jgi:D-tyrosyl-tRNA(Tyr) deacylase
MRAVVQRVSQGAVEVDGDIVGRIGPGLLVLLGVAADDAEKDADVLAGKIVNLRIFEDEAGKLNRSLVDCGGEILVVSQFTLYGDCRKGRRPSFVKAAAPEAGERLYERFVNQVRDLGVAVATGRFRSLMDVRLVNHGPVTLIVESPDPAGK